MYLGLRLGSPHSPIKLKPTFFEGLPDLNLKPIVPSAEGSKKGRLCPSFP